MSYIEELQQRVSQAEERFGLIDEQRKKYSERLINLMNTLEETLGHKQQELNILNRDNEQLREMLHSLLQAVEAGDPGQIGDTLRDLNTKMSALVGEPEPEEAAGEALFEEAAESPREMVAALEDELDKTPAEAPVNEAAGEEEDELIGTEPEDELIGGEEPAEEPEADASLAAVEAALAEDIPLEEPVEAVAGEEDATGGEIPAEEPAAAETVKEEDVSLAEVEQALNQNLPPEEAAGEPPAEADDETSAEVEAALAEAAQVVEEAAAEPEISAEEELDASLAEVEEALAETPEKPA